MTTELDCTYKVYSSDAIEFYFENNFKKVMCIKPIKKGDILLAEHDFYTTDDVLKKWVSQNTNAFNQLYPREIDSTALQKVNENIYEGNGDKYTLGIYDSWFNTSEKYNAGAKSFDISDCYLYFPISITFILALKDIEVGEEIFIYYTRESCGVFENDELQTKYLDEVDNICNDNSLNIYIILKNYILNQTSLDIYINQILQYDIIKLNELNKNKIEKFILKYDHLEFIDKIKLITSRDVFPLIIYQYDNIIKSLKINKKVNN